MEHVTFPRGPVSGTYLAIDNATWSADASEPVRYQNVPRDRHHYLSAWIRAHQGWRQSHREQINRGRSQGNVAFEIRWPGEYRICIDVAPERSGYSAVPEDAVECVPLFVVWGDPSIDYRPQVSVGDDPVLAGSTFDIGWSNFPPAPQARIEIREADTTFDQRATWHVATGGEAAGAAKAVLHEAGNYALYVFFENLGRQVRAARHFIVNESEEGENP